MIIDRVQKHLPVLSRFRVSIRNLLLIMTAALALTALIDFFILGLARRTFVFYAIDSGIAAVEERMMKENRSSSREAAITRYVEEALLGPVSPNSLPLFPKETRLLSLLYRNGVVYAGLSEDAALPLFESTALPGGEVFINMETLYSGIKRNFPYVRDVRFFIDGKAAYADKFR